MALSTVFPLMQFLSTPSARRATGQCLSAAHLKKISIHALREEGDQRRPGHPADLQEFLSTPSARRATHPPDPVHRGQPISIHALREEGDHRLEQKQNRVKNFYPRPPRGGRHRQRGQGQEEHRISIHALREEGDLEALSPVLEVIGFLSTPSARRATEKALNKADLQKFLSTPSARRATLHSRQFRPREEHFYPRPPRGGRLRIVQCVLCAVLFLSTPSARRATHRPAQEQHHNGISIHALREEGDFSGARRQASRPTISIHALREEGDPHTRGDALMHRRFLSTPSARRATAYSSRPAATGV